MPILNYSTTIQAAKTISEIQTNLSKHGAIAILIEYDDGEPVALSFKVNTKFGILPFRLPIEPKRVQTVLIRQRVSHNYQSYEQAVKVAWRLLKDWIAVLMAYLETEQVTITQLLLPYLMVDEGKTLYDQLAGKGFKQVGIGINQNKEEVQ
jgi:hypothetical protein